VHDQRETGQPLLNFFDDMEGDFGFAFEFISAVTGADGHSQRVAAGSFYEFFGLGRIGQMGGNVIDADHIFFDAAQPAQFGFYDNAVGVSILNYFFGNLDVFFKGKMGRVNHHRRKSVVHALFAQFEGVSVVQVHANRDIWIFRDSDIDNGFQIAHFCVFTSAAGNLQNQRGLFFCDSGHNTLGDFHIVNIERPNSVAVFVGHLKHLFCRYQSHSSSFLQYLFSFMRLYAAGIRAVDRIYSSSTGSVMPIYLRPIANSLTP